MKAVPGTPSWLRETNDRTALTLLLMHGALTRNRIGELSGLSKPTASQMVARLESAGLIHAVGEVSAGRGPSAASYAVRADRILGVAVDITFQSTRSSVVSVDGTAHPIVELALGKSARDRDPVADVRAAIEAACRASGLPADAVHLVCIGIQGSLDPKTEKLSFAEALPGWPRKGIRTRLEDALGMVVYIDNDVNLAAIAERRTGSTRDVTGFALLWMGDGLGLASDLGGVVHRGASGGAGEISYLPISHEAAHFVPDAKMLQELIGGPAVARLARGHGWHGRGYPQLIEALEHHPTRDAILHDLAPRIAVGVIPALALLDPERIVLGGPTGAVGGARLAELVRAAVRRTSRWNPDVVATTVAEAPVLNGAREFLLSEVRGALFSDVNMAATWPQHRSPVTT